MPTTVTVKRDGKRWAIFVNGKLVEGGFFEREAAETAAREHEHHAIGCPKTTPVGSPGHTMCWGAT